MNLSTDTIDVLKNFSNINQNILVNGKTVQTISTMKNILAERLRLKRSLVASLLSMTYQSF